jgi:nucleoside-diphosphate-sugar epimerase
MRSRRTAVLGGSGFIGRYVVKRLAARGDIVPVGCRNAEAAKFLRPMGDVGQVEPLNIAMNGEWRRCQLRRHSARDGIADIRAHPPHRPGGARADCAGCRG